MIEEFLKSKAALTALGLPGLAIMLAFLFYRSLLKAKVIKPLTQTQGFVILMSIIIYFAGATGLFAYYFNRSDASPTVKPDPAPSKPIASSEAQDKVAALMRKVRINTPVETYASAFGPSTEVITDSYGGATENHWFEDDSQRMAMVSTLKDIPIAIAAFDPKSKLPVPTLHVGWEKNGHSILWENLSDISLSDALIECDGKRSNWAAGKMGNFFVGPCYFGRPGSYNYFTFFFFIAEDMKQECSSELWLGEKSLTEKWIRSCNLEKYRPIGFLVSSGDGTDLVDEDIKKQQQAEGEYLDPIQVARASFLDRIIGDN